MLPVDSVAERISPKADGGHYFFGYYDKQPWDLSGQRVLAHRTMFLDRFPTPNDRAQIGYIDLHSEHEFVKLAETSAWNWQQGAQLQWLPNRRSPGEQILFNDRQENRLVAVLFDPVSRHKRVIGSPIYTVSPSRGHALSLNYARLFDMRMDYGIAGLQDPGRDVGCPEDDGVYRVDLASGESQLIVSIADVAAISRSPLGIDAKHWVNHMMFNPCGTRFCFLHRFWRPDGIMHSRLFTADSHGGNLRLLFEGMVSHYCWKAETTILAWAGKRRVLGRNTKSSVLATAARRCLKPMYYAMGKPRILMQKIVGDSYYLIEDVPGGSAERFAYETLSADGHCTISPNGRWVLTDGYTDSKNRLSVFLYNVQTTKLVNVGRFPTPKTLDGPVRVDLHPRFNRDGTKVCIDSAMNGTRQMYVIDVTDVVESA